PSDLLEMEMLVGSKSDYWQDSYPCYRCGGKAAGFHEAEIAADALLLIDVATLSTEEAYAALSGLGTPDEQTCCYEVLAPLLAEHGIKIYGRQPKGQARYFLDRIDLR